MLVALMGDAQLPVPLRVAFTHASIHSSAPAFFRKSMTVAFTYLGSSGKERAKA